MPDINSVIVKITAALDEAYEVAGLPNPAAQIAALQSQVTTMTQERDDARLVATDLQAKIAAARAAAQQDKDADAANVAGQGVLDALNG